MSDLNLDSLTYDRRVILTDGLGGLAIDILTGGLSTKSKKSLEVVGMSPVEIDSIEVANQRPGSYSIAHTESVPVNPFKKESFNLTAQILLLKEKPDLAKRLKRLAGMA